MFFMTPARNMFAGKLVKWVKFFAVLREFIFYNFEWVEVHKMSEIFWAKIFLYFCWIWDFLLQYLKLKDKLKIWNFKSFIFWSKVQFFGTVLGRFSQCNFKFFRFWPTIMAAILSPLTINSHLRPCSTFLIDTVNHKISFQVIPWYKRQDSLK